MDVVDEWKNAEASSHCLDNVCRWFLIRKDACLAILLFLWSLAVSTTLISANLEQFLQLCVSLASSGNEKKKEVAGPSESELAYNRQLKMEKERIAEIERRKSAAQLPLSREEREETVPLTTPQIDLSNIHPQKSVSLFTEKKSVQRRPSAPPEINLVNLNPSTNRRVQGREEVVPSAPPETSFTGLNPHTKIRPQSFRGIRPSLVVGSPKRRASDVSSFLHTGDLPGRMNPSLSQTIDRPLSSGICPYPIDSNPSVCPYPETDPLVANFPGRPYPYPY
ncbi:hypothetical protein PMAYCL1PPCAC_23677 [Pristionchus mayeri]|uniref:Uncharacterized protein n=1 Tax=Pristionchus mayeri TaxID=1317129 RepID=A0AAN5D0P1_9BILA|nr:hypothetical protein PMAYCL1PPCAC_23677 [Pristionchus mayeri]